MKKYKVIIDDDGSAKWFNLEGKLDREDGPAVDGPNGYKAWYKNGELYRNNDLPVIEDGYGGKQWRDVNSNLHRLTGPALIAGGIEEYWIDGQNYSQDDFCLKVAEIKFKKNMNTEKNKSLEDYEISARAYELVDERMRKMLNDYGQDYYSEIVHNLEEVEAAVGRLLSGMRKEFEAENYMEKDISKWSTPVLDDVAEKLARAIKAKTEFDCVVNMCEDIASDE